MAVEENLEAFLSMPIEAGSKLVVGGGPQLAQLQVKYPDVGFAGAKLGEELARPYASGDVLVFPSLTDTFRLVLLEALASGLPVAAYPVPGPLEVIGDPGCGVLDHDLAQASAQALEIARARCRAYALQFFPGMSTRRRGRIMGWRSPLRAGATRPRAGPW